MYRARVSILNCATIYIYKAPGRMMKPNRIYVRKDDPDKSSSGRAIVQNGPKKYGVTIIISDDPAAKGSRVRISTDLWHKYFNTMPSRVPFRIIPRLDGVQKSAAKCILTMMHYPDENKVMRKSIQGLGVWRITMDILAIYNWLRQNIMQTRRSASMNEFMQKVEMSFIAQHRAIMMLTADIVNGLYLTVNACTNQKVTCVEAIFELRALIPFVSGIDEYASMADVATTLEYVRSAVMFNKKTLFKVPLVGPEGLREIRLICESVGVSVSDVMNDIFVGGVSVLGDDWVVYLPSAKC